MAVEARRDPATHRGDGAPPDDPDDGLHQPEDLESRSDPARAGQEVGSGRPGWAHQRPARQAYWTPAQDSRTPGTSATGHGGTTSTVWTGGPVSPGVGGPMPTSNGFPGARDASDQADCRRPLRLR